MSLTISTYDPAMEAEVIALWTACDLIVPWNDPRKDIARKVIDSADLFLVATDGGHVIGTIMGGYDRHRGWINYLGVHPAHRRRGIGRQLVNRLESRLLALGCPKVNLQIRDTNAAAIDFYRKIGYCQDPVTSFGKRLISDD